ncbi:MAG TPA: hypothetical protein VFC67_12570 [Prolixibacteraceae bacterium]|nr:hypothetical protein [Prolixibacteraceae bacterium]
MRMRVARTFMMMFLIIVLCSWGNRGHQKINGSAPQFFPARLNNFKGWSAQLSEHGSDADDRKKDDRTEGVKHYIDIDAYKDFVEMHKITENKDAAFKLYGSKFILKNGTLPWVTDSTYHVLVQQFKSKEWTKAVLTAADLGHYVGDGHMPLHLTLNYDGKSTDQTGIHSRYESKMINKYIDEITVEKSPVHKVKDVNRYVFDYIYANYQYKDSLLNADKVAFETANHEYNDLYYATLWKQTQGFTRKMITESSKSLAELIRMAWLESGRPRLPRNITFQETPQN